jgi:hypothetical protein
MKIQNHLRRALLGLSVPVIFASATLAQDPGIALAPESAVSDQKVGSVLVFNFYTSDATAPGSPNSRLNITNTNSTTAAIVHLFFIGGSTCAAADAFICLTPNQTSSILALDIDPGSTGYVAERSIARLLQPPHRFAPGGVHA